MRLIDRLLGKKDNNTTAESAKVNTQTSVPLKADDVLYIAEIPYETGELQFRYSRKKSPDGTEWIRDGLFQEFYKNGNICSEGLYDDGLEDGPWKDYHENGELAAEGSYSKGKEIRTWRYYNAQGEFEEENFY